MRLVKARFFKRHKVKNDYGKEFNLKIGDKISQWGNPNYFYEIKYLQNNGYCVVIDINKNVHTETTISYKLIVNHISGDKNEKQ